MHGFRKEKIYSIFKREYHSKIFKKKDIQVQAEKVNTKEVSYRSQKQEQLPRTVELVFMGTDLQMENLHIFVSV